MDQTTDGQAGDETPRLPVARYDLHLSALDDVILTDDPRGTWHGVFRRALRAASCTTGHTDCDGCPLLHQCPYSYLFSAPRPPDSALMRRYQHVPVPHCFQLGAAPEHEIPHGRTTTVSVVLAGDANGHLPLVIEALSAAAAAGIGAERGRLRLDQVIQHLPESPEPHPIAGPDLPLTARPPQAPRPPSRPSTARLHLLSPYKASGAGPRPGGIDLGRYLMAIVRRISLLQYFYTGRQLQAPFAALKAASLRARPSAHALRPAAASRWASRHRRRIDTGGIVGHLDLPLDDIDALWPYLHLGQWLNVGKNASMGYGQYGLDKLGEP